MIELLDDPARFTELAGTLLQTDLEANLLATVLHGIQTGRFAERPPLFALVRTDTGSRPDVDADDGSTGGAVTAAALRTPPRPLLCTALAAPDDADALMRRWLTRDAALPGVNATTPTARALAGAWSRQTGGTTRLRGAITMHALDPAALSDPPRPAAGQLRRPTAGETPLLRAWAREFVAEAHLDEEPAAADAMLDALLHGERAYVWDVDGAPMSLVGHTVAIAGVPRVAPVYTPPGHRARGYASSAVAALSARLFDAGARRIVLFTDVANLTSNRIYAEVGYRRLADWEEHALMPVSAA